MLDTFCADWTRSASATHIHPTMVAGHILDAVDVLHSKVRGKARSGNREMPHNFVMCDKLRPWVKWAFWLTNVPYIYICGLALVESLPAKAMQHPVMECLRPYCTSNLFHALCVGSVALASSAFHGAQLNLDRSCACALRDWYQAIGRAEKLTGVTLSPLHEVGSMRVATPRGMRRRSGRLNDKRMSGSPRAFHDGVPNGLNDHPSDDEEELCQFVGEDAPIWEAPMAGAIAGVTGASPERRRLVSSLLFCDVLCANVYVMFLLSCIGAKRGHLYEVVEASAAPVVSMFVAAACKRRGMYHGYVFFHSIWHFTSALLMYEMLYERFGDSW